MPPYSADLVLAHRLADAADAISLARFRAVDLHVTAKPDLSPVTDADTAVEQALRELLARERPGDGVLGEECDDTEPAPGKHVRRWVIDPIDGTKSFIRGVPIWATLVALTIDDEPVVGVASAPALGRRWWAARGQGAFAGSDAAHGTRIRVSAVSNVGDASFCYSSLNVWKEARRMQPIVDLILDAWQSRAYGDFYGYVLLAEGAVDVMVYPSLGPWDVAALVPIIEEAGGTFTAFDRTLGPGYDGAIATNGKLHEVVLGRFGP